MENNGKTAGMEEKHLLLPWHVTGKLDPAEALELEELAKDDPEFAKLLAEASLEAEATASVNEALGGPPPGVWARIEASVEEEKRERRGSWAVHLASLKAAIANFFAGLTVSQWQVAAAAAVALCVVQAGVIAYLAGAGTGPAKFHAASGPQAQTSAKRPAFIVSFADKASIGAIGKALDEAGAVIVEGPNEDGLYHLGLRDDSVKAKDQAYAKLQASGLVTLILPEK